MSIDLYHNCTDTQRELTLTSAGSSKLLSWISTRHFLIKVWQRSQANAIFFLNNKYLASHYRFKWLEQKTIEVNFPDTNERAKWTMVYILKNKKSGYNPLIPSHFIQNCHTILREINTTLCQDLRNQARQNCQTGLCQVAYLMSRKTLFKDLEGDQILGATRWH